MNPQQLTLPFSREMVPSGLPEFLFVNGWHTIFDVCIINIQEVGVNYEHMESAIQFRTTRGTDTGGEHVQSLSCTIRQPYGSGLSIESAPLTVMLPIALQGEMSNDDFSRMAERYYRELVGANGTMINFNAPNIGNVEFHNISVSSPRVAIIHPAELPINAAWNS